MADKPKVPKGTQNIDCITLLPDMLAEEFASEFGTAQRGNLEGLAWGDMQKADLEYYKFRKDLQVMANARIFARVTGHTEGPKWGARSVLAADRMEGGVEVGAEGVKKAVRGKLGSILSEFFDAYRPQYLGFQRDREGVINMIRELWGQGTKDVDAAKYADGWKQMSEYVRKRLNAAGARIAKLDDWGMPQYHNPGKVSEVTSEEWVQFLTDKLDWVRMGEETGMSSQQIRDLLINEVYHNIATDGAHKIDLNAFGNAKSGMGILNKLKQHRFMHFKDADSWIEYQDRFGSDDYVTTMDNWMDNMATQIAALETFGPNPEIGLAQLHAALRKEGLADQISWIDKLYKNFMGEVGVANVEAASAGSAMRSANIVMHLGNATLSMATDPVMLSATARYNDVPVLQTLKRMVTLAAKNALSNSEDFEFLARTGFVNEYATDRLLAAARYTDVVPHKWMSRLSEGAVRASWMHNLTMAGRGAFQLEYSAALAKDVGKEWGELSPRRRAAFERVQITPDDWDYIRSKGVVSRNGVDYIDINKVGAVDGKYQATKLSALVNQETDWAVPTPGLETRTWQNQGLARGTVAGEAVRFGMEFKSFPITMLMNHMRRAMHGKAMNRLTYGGFMVAGLFMMGQVATMLKDISRGIDPQSLLDEEGNVDMKQTFRALAQGGGLGIYGDFIFRDQTRYGASIAETILGPTVGAGADAIALAQQSMKAAYDEMAEDGDAEEADKLKLMIADNLQRYMPTLWQVRAVQDRAFNKAMNALTDDEWERKLDRRDRRREKETGQEVFWPNDQMTPERAPRAARSDR